MGLMSSLYTGVSGLTANQRGLTVSGHNLANVETAGFVRQQMETTDTLYLNLGTNATGLLQSGIGTSVSTIKQYRDRFLDTTYREEIGRKNYYQLQYEATTELEEILGETEGVQFQDSLAEFWVAMQELCKEPDSIVTRSSFIQTAASFVERAEEVYNQIGDYQLSLNTQIQTYVDKANDISKQIYDLNHEIRKIEASGFEKANDLRDQRNVLLDELASIVNITYKEEPDSIVTVYAEGYALITDDLLFKMDTRPLNDTTNMIEPYWPNYDEVSVYKMDRIPSPQADDDIGGLKGLLMARGQKVGRFYDIPVAPTEEEYTVNGVFDATAYNAARVEYDKEVAYYDIHVEGSVVVSVQAQFDKLIHNITTTINDFLCPNKEVTLVSGEKIKIFDEENAPVGMDEFDTPAEALFNRKSMDRYKIQDITIDNGNGTTSTITARVYNEEDITNNYSLFTIGEIEVNDNIMKDPSVIPLSDNRGTGDFCIKICEDILTAWQSPIDTITPTNYSKQNFNDYYTEMIGLLGTNGEKFKNIFESQESLTNSVDNQRQAKMAVSSDEELTNIIKYQQGYNANSRFISTVNDMLRHLLEALG